MIYHKESGEYRHNVLAFTPEEYNFARLVIYVRQKGQRVLQKYVVDMLYTHQLFNAETSLREKLNHSQIARIFPNEDDYMSLDRLNDADLIDVATLVFNITDDLNDPNELRRLVYLELEGPIFHKFMEDRKEKFRKKLIKQLSQNHFKILYPPGDNVNIRELDITALCFILFEGFPCLKPVTDLNKLPVDRNKSPGSDILRIRLYRNYLSHNAQAEIDDEEFDKIWDHMTKAFERLTGDPSYRKEGDMLKREKKHLDMDRFQSTLEKWRTDCQDEQFGDLKGTISSASVLIEKVIKDSALHTEKTIEDSARNIISAVKKCTKHKRKKRHWHQAYIKDVRKFKAVCEKEGIRYKLPDDSSTENSSESSSTGTSPRYNQRYSGRAEDDVDPTGYFLSLQRREEYIHSNNTTHHLSRKTYGNIRSVTNKSGMYSEDSTDYNTDLVTLNSSVDGNMSSDTLLFQPVRLPTAHTSPRCGIHGTPLTTGEYVFDHSFRPCAFQNETDDGYASNEYFSSLDRNLSTTPDQFRVLSLQNTVKYNATETFVYREVGTPDTDQDNSVIVRDNFRQSERIRTPFTEFFASSRYSTESTDVSGRFDGILLSESQHPDKGLRIGNDTDYRKDELEEIFV